MPNKSITMRGGAGGSIWIRDDNFAYDSTGADQLKTSLANKTIKYQLAKPQVTRIPRKHLAVVDLGSLDGYLSNDRYFISSEYLGINIMSSNDNGYACYCKDYLIDSGYNVYNKTKDKTMCLTSPFIGNNFIIWDSSFIGKTAEEIKALLSETYLFYETQDEVEDIDFEIGIEAGGTLTSNWFSWVENQQCIIPTISSTTTNGVTLTNNGDGSVTIQGTASANTTFTLMGNLSRNIPFGHKVFITNFANANHNTYYLYDAYESNISYDMLDSHYGYIKSKDGSDTTISPRVYILNGTNISTPQTLKVMYVDLTLAFGVGNEPTSVNDPRIQYIIKQGYIPTNITGTNKTIASEVLPNIDFKMKCR